jgi:hypothetical protein
VARTSARLSAGGAERRITNLIQQEGNPMNKLSCLAAVAALAMLTSPAAAAARVDIVKVPSAALAKGSSFAWAPVAAVGVGLPDPAIANEITAERLRTITEATLVAKGYREVGDPGQADFVISYTIGMLPMSDADISTGACDAPTCAAPANANLDSSIHTEGMIVLDLTERSTGRLVWRATSRKRLTGRDVSDRRLATLLREMTRSLPAQVRP